MNKIEEEFAESLEKRLYAEIENFAAADNLLMRCRELQDPKVRCKYAFELLKCLSLSRDIPSLANSSYLKEQLKFLEEIITILERDQDPSQVNYRKISPNKGHLYVLEEENPVAVFKPSQYERDNEVAFWEISFMLGLNDISVPCTPVVLQNSLGNIQRYIKNEVDPSKKSTRKDMITNNSFTHTSLGVLVFGLRDIHYRNMAYTSSAGKNFDIRLFDTAEAFTGNNFETGTKDDYKWLKPPFAWVGWDYPQASAPLTKSERTTLKQLLNKWSAEDLISFVKHPMTNFILTEKELSDLINRVKKLKKIGKISTPLSWLSRLAPQYPALQKKLKYFFPTKDPNLILFYMQWKPNRIRAWLPGQKAKAFDKWLEVFCAAQNKKRCSI